MKKIIILILIIVNIFNLPINKSQIYANELYSEEYIKQQEEEFKSNNYLGSSNDFEYKLGNIPILISAPHTVKQWRDDTYKNAEAYTGALAKILNESSGAHVIYKTSVNGDENYTTSETEYRKKISDIVKNNEIKVIIDLHGMTSDKDSDIDIGTGNSKNKNLLGQDYILSLIEDSLSNVNYTKNKYFTGGGAYTMSTYCSTNLGIPTIQLEINRKFRSSDSASFSHMANQLTKMINEVSKKVCKPMGKIVNVKQSLNFRSSKSTDSSENIIGKIKPNTSITILDNINNVNERNEWIRIKYCDNIGYIKSNYISLYDIGKIVNVNKSIKLRITANTNSSAVCTIPKGSYVTIYEDGKTCKVNYNDKIGYFNEKYLEKI